MAVILVIDDEPDVVEILRYRLTQDGHTVLAATDGPSGLSRAMIRRPDLVILDVMMPDMDGFEVLRRLKYYHRSFQIPVIMLTAKSDDPSIALARDLKVDHYVTKPFDINELAEIVRDVLAQRDAAGPQDAQIGADQSPAADDADDVEELLEYAELDGFTRDAIKSIEVVIPTPEQRRERSVWTVQILFHTRPDEQARESVTVRHCRTEGEASELVARLLADLAKPKQAAPAAAPQNRVG